MSLFLLDSCTILHISCKKWCKILQVAARIITCISCTFLQDLARIGARLCRNRARKGTYRVHVPSKSCMQDSCTILHDLASSFLLGLYIISTILRVKEPNLCALLQHNIVGVVMGVVSEVYLGYFLKRHLYIIITNSAHFAKPKNYAALPKIAE